MFMNTNPNPRNPYGRLCYPGPICKADMDWEKVYMELTVKGLKSHVGRYNAVWEKVSQRTRLWKHVLAGHARTVIRSLTLWTIIRSAIHYCNRLACSHSRTDYFRHMGFRQSGSELLPFELKEDKEKKMIYPQYSYPSYYPQMQNMYTTATAASRLRSRSEAAALCRWRTRTKQALSCRTWLYSEPWETKTGLISMKKQWVIHSLTSLYSEKHGSYLRTMLKYRKSRRSRKSRPSRRRIYAELRAAEALRDAVALGIQKRKCATGSSHFRGGLSYDEPMGIICRHFMQFMQNPAGPFFSQRYADAASECDAITAGHDPVHDEFRRYFSATV